MNNETTSVQEPKTHANTIALAIVILLATFAGGVWVGFMWNQDTSIFDQAPESYQISFPVVHHWFRDKQGHLVYWDSDTEIPKKYSKDLTPIDSNQIKEEERVKNVPWVK